MAHMQVFLCSTPEDRTAAGALLTALREAGAEVDLWYADHASGAATLPEDITQRLRSCPVFLTLLSPHALASDLVHIACEQAVALQSKVGGRGLLAVVAAPVASSQVDM